MIYTKNIFKILLVSFVVLFSYTEKSFAQSTGKTGNSADRFYFEETFFPVFTSKNDADSLAGGSIDKSVSTESGFGFDARTTLGYVWANILMGLTFNIYDASSSRGHTSTAEGVKFKTAKQEFGPTIGYFLGSWRFAFTYFVSASKTFSQTYTGTNGAVSTDETYKNSSGSGMQLAIGYDFEIGAGFSISPTLIYRTVSYSKQSREVKAGASAAYDKAKLQTKAIDNELKPMITLSYSF